MGGTLACRGEVVVVETEQIGIPYLTHPLPLTSPYALEPQPPKQLSVTNSIAVLRPDVAEFWSKTKNLEKAKPENMMLTAKKAKVWFECSKGEDHLWQLKLEDALKEGGLECPCCAGKKLSVTNCLLTVRPDIAEMWLLGGENAERIPEGVMAMTDGTGWLSWEGRQWEVNISEVVRREGRPVPPPLPPPVIVEEEEPGEGEKIGVENSAEELAGGEDREGEKSVLEEEREEEKVKKRNWKDKFKSVLGAFMGRKGM